MRFFIIALLGLILGGCASDNSDTLGKQRLGDVVIEVQCRPAPVTVGMNEFLILATDINGAPVHDLLVDVRIKDNDKWRQAIQDGFSGVYRKAIGVQSLDQQLEVRIMQSGQVTELRFPLKSDRSG